MASNEKVASSSSPDHIDVTADEQTEPYVVEGSRQTPYFEGHVQRGNPNSPTEIADTKKGIYGLAVPGEALTFTDKDKYAGHTVDEIAPFLAKRVAEESQSPLVIFGKDGIVYRAPEDSPYRIVRVRDEKTAELLGSAKQPIGSYQPEKGERLYIVEPEVAKHLQAHPGTQEGVLDLMLEKNASFALIDVDPDQVAAMKTAGNIGKMRQRAAREGAMKSSASEAATETVTKPVYAAKTGPEEPIIDTEVVEPEPASTHRGAHAKATALDTPAYGIATSAPHTPRHAAPVVYDRPIGPELDPTYHPPLTTSDDEVTKVTPLPVAAEATAATAADTVSTDSVPTPTDTDTAGMTPVDSYTVPFGPAAPVEASQAYLGYREADSRLARAEAQRLKLGMFAFKRREKLDRLIKATSIAHDRRIGVVSKMEEEAWKNDTTRLGRSELADKLVESLHQKETAHEERVHSEFRNIKKWGKLSEIHDTISERYANLTRKQRLAVNIGATAVIGAGALLAGPSLGVVGAAGMLGAKVYKTYAQSRAGLYETHASAEKVSATDEHGTLKSRKRIRQDAIDQMAQKRAGRIEKADKINKRARWTMIGSMALLGSGILSHVDVVRDTYGAVGHQIGDWLQGDTGLHDIAHTGGDLPAAEHLGSDPDLNPHHEFTFQKPQVPVAPKPVEFLTGTGGTTEFTPAGLQNAHEWLNNYQVKSGDTIWNLSKQYLEAHNVPNPNVYQIDAVKDQLLSDFQQRGLVGASGWLTAGQTLKF